jgi:hypothetical protein
MREVGAIWPEKNQLSRSDVECYVSEYYGWNGSLLPFQLPVLFSRASRIALLTDSLIQTNI